MITDAQIDHWLTVNAETENLEFKKAERTFRDDEVARYAVGIGNAGGGWLVLGVTDKAPREVVGSAAYGSQSARNKLKNWIFQTVGVELDVLEAEHEGKRLVAIKIPSRPPGRTISYKGQRLIRRGESLVAISDDKLKQILTEPDPDWSEQLAAEDCSSAEVVELLDTQTYFELIGKPYPSTQDRVLERLSRDNLIREQGGSWAISNLAAIALAKRLNAFSEALAAKAPRFIVYEGTDKRVTRNEVTGVRGYAVGFAGLVTSVHDAGPDNRFDEQLIRDERKMFPKNALRELIANALVHQDFGQTGLSVRIELYSDRLEMMSPGSPIVETNRFVDEDKARNERLSKLFARLGLCERKGSGIDKVMWEVEYHQLPAPAFRGGTSRTNVVLFAYRPFSEMDRDDRIRACYLHCCLQHISNRKTNNSSLRERFGLANSSSTTSQISQVLRDTRDAELVKIDSEASSAPRYARYLPYWA